MGAGRRLGVVLAAAAGGVAAVVALVALSSGEAGTEGAGGRAAEASAAPSVQVARSRYGRMLVDRDGRTLYLFDRDPRGKSVCTGRCARVWPPALVAGRPTAGRGLDAAKLTTIARGGSARRSSTTAIRSTP